MTPEQIERLEKLLGVDHDDISPWSVREMQNLSRALLTEREELQAAAKLHEYGHLATIAAKNKELAEQEHALAEERGREIERLAKLEISKASCCSKNEAEIERLKERISDLECISGLKEALEGCEHKARLAKVVEAGQRCMEISTALAIAGIVGHQDILDVMGAALRRPAKGGEPCS